MVKVEMVAGHQLLLQNKYQVLSIVHIVIIWSGGLASIFWAAVLV